MFGKDQRRFVTAHGAVRLILSEYTGVDPSELSFAQGENGKPYLRPSPGGGDVFFNLSHSGDYTLIAVTKCLRVGIDIEGIRANIEYLEMSRKVFSPERMRLARQPAPVSEQVAAFFRVWVVKEAFLKATGVGLSDSLNEIAVTFTSNGNAGSGMARQQFARNSLACRRNEPCSRICFGAGRGRGRTDPENVEFD